MEKYCNMSIIFSVFPKILNNLSLPILSVWETDVFLHVPPYGIFEFSMKENHYQKISSSTWQFCKAMKLHFAFSHKKINRKRKILILKSVSVSSQKESLGL